MTSAADWESRIGRRLRLRDLHVFFAVVRSGSMAKAASHLRVTQPSVSKAIGDLEAALGVRLFDRSPQGVRPTMYGDALIKCGSAVFDELRLGVRSIEFLADPTRGELRIGCAESLSAAILPPIIERFAQRYPHVVLNVDAVVTGTPEIPTLRDRTLDLVLARMRPLAELDFPEDLNVEVLFDDRLAFAVGTQSRWAGRRKIELAELADERWILPAVETWSYRMLADAFQQAGMDVPKHSLRTLSVHLRTNLLASGHFITVLPRSVLQLHAKRFSLKALPIDMPGRPWPVAVVTLKNRTLSPVVERFIDCAREVTKPLRRGQVAEAMSA
jgi:DNA-binding transcriptional LysR family regulator